MDQFINSKETLVTEALDGLLRLSSGRLARLDGYPHIKVIVRTDWDKSKVAIISGGGSGHEPAHAGFVGEGLLTAAVCGEVFASPSVDGVLAGILAVTGDAGCLLIVKNYTGDRLNFGLAAERARALGKHVEMVVVADDIALPDMPQPRGVAGTLLVHKIAGDLAASGADLAAVSSAARRVIENVYSIGMSLDTCTIPGAPKDERIALGKAELGLGIHGESGVETVVFEAASAAMATVLDRLKPHIQEGVDYVCLLNNLGGCTPLEMGVLADELCRSNLACSIKLMIGPAGLMTSLDMRGFSVSILRLEIEDFARLRSVVGPQAWPVAVELQEPKIIGMPTGIVPASNIPSSNPQRRDLIVRICEILERHEADLNALDAKTGDGDTGSTIATAARGLRASIDQLPLADYSALYTAIANGLTTQMGGSSGVLLAIMFAAAGDAGRDGAGWLDALKLGLKRMSEVGGASLGDRTMIDALDPALAALKLSNSLGEAASAARKGADITAKMTVARAGRAAYVPSSALADTPDPGAEAVARLFAGLVE